VIWDGVGGDEDEAVAITVCFCGPWGGVRVGEGLDDVSRVPLECDEFSRIPEAAAIFKLSGDV